MTNQQLYFAIGVPVFALVVGLAMNILVIVWQSKSVEKVLNAHMTSINTQFATISGRFATIDSRLDRIESRLTTIEQDYKVFFQDIVRIKTKVGL
jgi:ABC-type uncharacterized transport system YnjBCD permease subunit